MGKREKGQKKTPFFQTNATNVHIHNFLQGSLNLRFLVITPHHIALTRAQNPQDFWLTFKLTPTHLHASPRPYPGSKMYTYVQSGSKKNVRSSIG